MLKANQEYNALVTLENDNFSIKDFPCEISTTSEINKEFLIQFNRHPDIFNIQSGKYNFISNVENTNNESIKMKAKIAVNTQNISLNAISYSCYPYNIETTIDLVNMPESSPKVMFSISKCKELTPNRIRYEHSNGSVDVEEYSILTLNYKDKYKIIFDEIIEYRENKIFSKNVIYVEKDIPFGKNEINEEILYIIKHILIFCSFAFDKRIFIYNWEAYINNQNIKQYYNVPSENQEDSNNHLKEVINYWDIADFLEKIINLDYKSENSILMHNAIYNIEPLSDSIIETDFLNCFAAFESILSIYKIKNDLKYSIKNKKWDKMQDFIKTVIEEHDDLFEREINTDDVDKDKIKEKYKNFFIKKLPELQRISIRDVYNNYIIDYRIDDDLWPVFEKTKVQKSLNDIRNHIIHGNSSDLLNYETVIIAIRSIKILVKRMILIEIDWPIQKSNVSKGYLENFKYILTVNSDQEIIRKS